MPKELEGIIESNGVNIKFEGNLGTFVYPDELAQAIQDYIDAGYIKKSEVRVDEESIITILDNFWWGRSRNRYCQFVDVPNGYKGISVKFTKKELAQAISNHIQELIRGKG